MLHSYYVTTFDRWGKFTVVLRNAIKADTMALGTINVGNGSIFSFAAARRLLVYDQCGKSRLLSSMCRSIRRY